MISRLAAARLLEETGKEASFDTFKRVLKKAYVWKRCRQSVKGNRNEANFQRDKEYLESLLCWITPLSIGVLHLKRS